MQRDHDLLSTQPPATSHAEFAASATAVATWNRAHPWTLDAYLDFLDDLQRAFGPFPISRDVPRGGAFRL